MRLALTVPHCAGESATSLFSRLAARNMCLSARHFGRDMDLPFQDVINGMPEAIARLEVLAGLDSGSLSADTLALDEGRIFTLNGQRLTASATNRTVLAGCPVCMLADFPAGPYEPEINAFGRTLNEVVHLRTCPRHGVARTLIGRPQQPSHTHDFSLVFRDNIKRLPQLADTADRRPASDFEAYLENRLKGVQTESPWLNTLGFSAAAKVCEMFGAVAEFGTTPNLKAFSDGDWACAGASGFTLFRNGVQEALDFLESLQRRDELKGASGPQQAYGRIYQWLAFQSDDPDLQPIKAMVRNHIVETMPIGAGDEIFGVKVAQRRVHSLRTAALQHGVHPKTAAKFLRGSGMVSSDSANLTDNQILLPADPVDLLMARVAQGIQRKALHEFMNISRTHLTALLGAGHLTPILEAEQLDMLYDEADVAAFMTRATKNAEVVVEPTEDQVSLQKSTKRACCSIPEVQDLLIGGNLDWVGVRADERGYGAILVSLSEVRRKTELSAPDGVTAHVIISDFGAHWPAIQLLIRTGVLPTIDAINPRNRCPVKVVPAADYRRFKDTYVSLRNLSRECGKGSRQLRKELASRGIFPLPECEEVGGLIFRRDQMN